MRAAGFTQCGSLILLLVFPFLGVGQQATTSGPPPAIVGSTVLGTVVNASTADPLRHVRVALHPLSGTNKSTYSIETDDAGRFALTGVLPGKYEITASRNGFLAYPFNSRGQTRGTTVEAGTNVPTRPLRLRLFPLSVISGRVTDQEGDPIAGTEVQVTQSGPPAELPTRTTAITNDLGEYRLYGLAPGQYYVSASAATRTTIMSQRVTDSASLENYVRTFYPRATDITTAQNVVLRPGDQASNIDIQLVKSAPRVVKVIDLTTSLPEQGALQQSDSAAAAAGPMESTELPRTSSVSGQVVNAVTSEPVRHARVTLLNVASGEGIPYVTNCDDTGAFRIAHIEPGDYRLSVLRDGFLPSAGYSGGRGKSVSIKPGADVANVVVRISPASVITGTVVTPDGDLAANMRVQAIQLGHAAGRPQLRVLATAQTDDLGQYRLYGLPPGNYYVQASAPRPPAAGANSTRARPPLEYISSFYPRAGDHFSAAEVAVDAGNVVGGIDISTETRRTVTVRGRVVNAAAGRISRETVVSLTPEDGMGGISSGTRIADVQDSDGHFELRDILPGSYVISAILPVGTSQSAGSTSLEVRTFDLNNVQVVMNPAANTTAAVRVDGAERLDARRIRVFLEPESHLPTGTVEGHLRRDGTFSLRHVLPDRYTVKLLGIPETFYISAIEVGDRPVDGRVIDFSRGVMPLQVSLSAAGGTLTGSVIGPQQNTVSGATVVLVPNGDSRASHYLYKVVRTAKDGTFKIVGVSPGAYTLFAWSRVEADAYYDPDFLASFEDLGKQVVVHENTSQAIELPLLATE